LALVAALLPHLAYVPQVTIVHKVQIWKFHFPTAGLALFARSERTVWQEHQNQSSAQSARLAREKVCKLQRTAHHALQARTVHLLVLSQMRMVQVQRTFATLATSASSVLRCQTQPLKAVLATLATSVQQARTARQEHTPLHRARPDTFLTVQGLCLLPNARHALVGGLAPAARLLLLRNVLTATFASRLRLSRPPKAALRLLQCTTCAQSDTSVQKELPIQWNVRTATLPMSSASLLARFAPVESSAPTASPSHHAHKDSIAQLVPAWMCFRAHEAFTALLKTLHLLLSVRLALQASTAGMPAFPNRPDCVQLDIGARPALMRANQLKLGQTKLNAVLTLLGMRAFVRQAATARKGARIQSRAMLGPTQRQPGLRFALHALLVSCAQKVRTTLLTSRAVLAGSALKRRLLKTNAHLGPTAEMNVSVRRRNACLAQLASSATALSRRPRQGAAPRDIIALAALRLQRHQMASLVVHVLQASCVLVAALSLSLVLLVFIALQVNPRFIQARVPQGFIAQEAQLSTIQLMVSQVTNVLLASSVQKLLERRRLA